MIENKEYKKKLNTDGFCIVHNIFSSQEIESILNLINHSQKKYAIRQLINHYPKIKDLIFSNPVFNKLFSSICDKNYFLSKAIYFNKPSKSNWFVGYHQDLSISVQKIQETKGFSNCTNKNKQIGVIPPLRIVENTITFRIHLDSTDETNGALKVLVNSHNRGIIRIDSTFNKQSWKALTCHVPKGGVMLMKPLLLHASAKSTSKNDRRVIHLEFCNEHIPMGWLEKKRVS